MFWSGPRCWSTFGEIAALVALHPRRAQGPERGESLQTRRKANAGEPLLFFLLFFFQGTLRSLSVGGTQPLFSVSLSLSPLGRERGGSIKKEPCATLFGFVYAFPLSMTLGYSGEEVAVSRFCFPQNSSHVYGFVSPHPGKSPPAGKVHLRGCVEGGEGERRVARLFPSLPPSSPRLNECPNDLTHPFP